MRIRVSVDPDALDIAVPTTDTDDAPTVPSITFIKKVQRGSSDTEAPSASDSA